MLRNEKGTRVRGWIRKNTIIGPVLNIQVCNHDDRYSIEVQVPSLFQDNTVSWVTIVNDVDKHVTESMQDIASEKPIAKVRPRPKPTVTLTSVLERKWIDIDTQRSTRSSVMKSQKRSLDSCDMINQSLEEATERSTTVTSSKSAGRRSLTTLRNGSLKIGCQLWQKGRRSEEKISMLRESTLFQSIPVPSSNSRTFRR